MSAPVVEQFNSVVPAELRTRLSQMAQGFAETEIDTLRNELHRGHYKRRNPKWSAYEVKMVNKGTDSSGNPIFEEQALLNNEKADALDVVLTDEIQIYETARTVMMNSLTDNASAAGARSEEDFNDIIPKLWQSALEQVRGVPDQPAEEAYVAEPTAPGPPDGLDEDTPDSGEETEAIDFNLPSARMRDFEEMPTNPQKAPREENWMEVLDRKSKED